MELIAVNVGMPAPLPDGRTGRTVLSGIRKHRVGLPLVQVDEVNIEGDGQADLDNHGGVDKAVYCYSHDHLPAWMAEIGYGEDRDAPFGENLSLRGAIESDVQIGDRWPCFKLGLHAGDPGLPARLIESERSGWYSRVIATGTAPTSGRLELVHREATAPTVREAFQAARSRLDRDRAMAIAATPALASSWRSMIVRRYPVVSGQR